MAVDAYTRWVKLKALQTKHARVVANAIVETVLCNTAGAAKLIVSDQGSEFKGEMKQAMQLLNVEQKYTAAYRSEGHGLAERYNRALADKLKSMVTENDPEWHLALPWAKMAHNSSVHRALSQAGEGITPGEVQTGRRFNMLLEENLSEAAVGGGTRQPGVYLSQLKKHMVAVSAWVKESRDKYNTQMRKQANKKASKQQITLKPGDTVALLRILQGTKRKLLRPAEGPWQVVRASPEFEGEYEIQKVGEGVKTKDRVHANRLVPYRDVMELATHHSWDRSDGSLNVDWPSCSTPALHSQEDARAPPPQALTEAIEQRLNAEKEDVWEIEQILGDSGTRAEGNKQFHIRWKGYGPEEDSWEPLENLVHCAVSVQEYELGQVGIFSVERACDRPQADKVGPWFLDFSRTGDQGQSQTLIMDLNGRETPEEVLQLICNKANISKEDIELVWASPPCETFSKANWSNLTRGNNYRKPERGHPPVEGTKGDKAGQHDRLVQRIKAICLQIKKSVIENPAGGLEFQEYMKDEAGKMVVDLCNYVWPFKKTTNLWVNGFDWTPRGLSGSGRCKE